MAKVTFQSVDDYLKAQPERVREALSTVRAALRKAIPQADEVISYNMPTYEIGGVPVLLLAGWANHYSLYAASSAIVAAFGKELAGYKVRKGTISFSLSEPVPVDLIERIAKFRAEEVAAHKKA